MLNHPIVERFIDALQSVFGDPDVGWDAARTIGEIASGGDDVLTKSNHAIIRVSIDFNAEQRGIQTTPISDSLCTKVL